MKKILIVDDDIHYLNMLKEFLSKENFKIRTASNGYEALDQIEKEKPDIVLTDIIMPDKEGIQVIRELRLKDKNIPIFAMSGGGRIEPNNYLKIAQKLGAHKTFVKPFSLNELHMAIKEALGL